MQAKWIAAGSKPATDGQVEGILDREVVGAINAVTPHPCDSSKLYVGAVNGGIWKTTQALQPKPKWKPLTDELSSLSIGALAIDPSKFTLIAGTGRFSSNAKKGGHLLGILTSIDDGANWDVHDHNGLFQRLHFRSVAARENVFLVAGNSPVSPRLSGIYRSADFGRSWTHLSGSALPAGSVFALAEDPQNTDRFYADVSPHGIYRSDDLGANWTKISDTKIEALMALGYVNLKLSSGPQDVVFLAIAGSGRQALTGLFQSKNAGATWVSLDIPHTKEFRGDLMGIHPGGQAGIHFSLAAHPTREDLVFIGGDRQPSFNEGPNGRAAPRRWPNSIGANDYSGRLFCVDASRAKGRQARPITHRLTGSGSSPHADSRSMAFDADGDLIEGDDGGVYRRTKPASNRGDWKSMNGDLQISEFHSIAWDPLTQTIIGGAQDTGTQQQMKTQDTDWPSVSTGDGGAVAAALSQNAAYSIRVSSYQYLGGIRREFYDAKGQLQRRERVKLRPVPGSHALSAAFYTPLLINSSDSRRMILGASNGVFESFDQGDTVKLIDPFRLRVNSIAAIAYGSSSDPDIIWLGSGSEVWRRSGGSAAPLRPAAPLPIPDNVRAVAIDRDDHRSAFVVTDDRIFETNDLGATWSDVTGNIASEGAKTFRAVAFTRAVDNGTLFVGSNVGVFALNATGTANWFKVGSGFPAAPILQMHFSDIDQILICGTLGRGAYYAEFSPADETAIA